VKVAIVVQRYGSEVLGGSESLARQYAHSLAGHAAVEVLTTCALDHVSWRNHYPPGVAPDGPVRVRRFAVDFERGDHFFKCLNPLLHGALRVEDFLRHPHCRTAYINRVRAMPVALQEEVLCRQGPYSSALLAYLEAQRHAYDVFLFCTYLYSPTYHGMQAVPAERIAFCPTLHDEPMAYLPIYRKVFRCPRLTLFLSQAEQELAWRLFGDNGSSAVVGMAIPPLPDAGAVPDGTPDHYVLYAGRLEPAKGTFDLIQHFLTFKLGHPSNLKLVLIGKESAPLPQHPDIVHLGFVTEEQKFALMRGARAFLHPSAFESFAIVLLESFRAGVPALVNGHSAALTEHCHRSGAGLTYHTREEFVAGLAQLLADDRRRREMGERGQRYVAQHFAPEVVSARLWRHIAAMTSASSASGGQAPPARPSLVQRSHPCNWPGAC
jgi:glycosyltransferase involved in cell wall biosynthesis